MNILEPPHGVKAKVLNSNLQMSEFEFQPHYYVFFQTNTLGKVIEPLYFPSLNGLNSITGVFLQGWLWY